ERYTGTTSITGPKGQTAISGGELVGEKDMGQYSEFTWHTNIPTRGISFAAGEYTIKSTLFKHTTVECYTYQEASSLANKCLKTATDMLEFYSSKFGDYPYAKFAVVEIPGFFSGGHGDQSFVMMDSNLFMSFLPSEFLAHEVAHNWWGALVFAEGENSLRSVKGYWNFPKAMSTEAGIERYNYWLLEGFATYSSLLYIEDVKGREDMISSLEEKRLEYLDRTRNGQDEPISRVEEEYGEGRYHAIVYSKGAWVLHMLRYVVGDEAYFSIMRNYAQKFREKSASIGDFQEVSEEVYGKDMDWFFDQWVDSVMLPDYAIGGADVNKNSGKYLVRATVIQMGDLGKMPVDIILHTKGEDIKKRIWIDEEQETVSFITDSEPTHIEIDGDHWILESNKYNNIYFLSSSSIWRRLKHIIWRLRQLL
ncbi:MAG: M1 family aminopeptidase, partial [Candidatus Hydrothermarchaeales archaeon]